MLESLNVIRTLCKHKKLIEKIFDARMTIQKLNNFTALEQDDIVYLSDAKTILSIDNEDIVWLNPDIEKALETLSGTSEQIDLGRIEEFIKNIDSELLRYITYKREMSVTKIVKYFNNILHLLQENTKLVVKKRESEYGGSQSYEEKLEYIDHLLKQARRLDTEVVGLEHYLDKNRDFLLSIEHMILGKKVLEVYTTVRDVRDTLLSEITSIDALQKRVANKKAQSHLIEKLKMVDYLLEKRRFFAESNYESLVSYIPTQCKIKIKTHLNSRYADSESYRERILALSQKEKMQTLLKKQERKEYKSRERKSIPKEVFYIDPHDIYENFSTQEQSLLKYMESIEFGDGDFMESYLEVLDICAQRFDLSQFDLQETEDGEYEVLSPYIKKEHSL